jgi:hypothetical protein
VNDNYSSEENNPYLLPSDREEHDIPEEPELLKPEKPNFIQKVMVAFGIITLVGPAVLLVILFILVTLLQQA